MHSYTILKPVNSFLPMAGVIWAIFAGFAIAVLLSYYHKTYTGETVRRLLKKEAFSEQSALTLKELGLSSSRLRTLSLEDGKLLRRYVEITGPEEAVTEPDKKKRKGIFGFLFPSAKKHSYDFDSVRLYIPEEKKYAADARFEQKGTISPVALAVILALLFASAVAVTVFLPDILQIADNFLTSIFKSEP